MLGGSSWKTCESNVLDGSSGISVVAALETYIVLIPSNQCGYVFICRGM